MGMLATIQAAGVRIVLAYVYLIRHHFRVYDIDKEAGIHQFSFYAIWFFTTCGLLVVVVPLYIFYIYKRSTIETDAANDFKYTLLDYNEVRSERIPADWKSAKAICFGDSVISSKRGRMTVKHFPSNSPRKTNATSSEVKLSPATKVPSSKASRTSIDMALELAKKISLAMKNCPCDMPVDSIMSESPQGYTSSRSAGRQASFDTTFDSEQQDGAGVVGRTSHFMCLPSSFENGTESPSFVPANAHDRSSTLAFHRRICGSVNTVRNTQSCTSPGCNSKANFESRHLSPQVTFTSSSISPVHSDKDHSALSTPNESTYRI